MPNTFKQKCSQIAVHTVTKYGKDLNGYIPSFTRQRDPNMAQNVGAETKQTNFSPFIIASDHLGGP